jgi:CRISPR-associated protein Cmr2
VSELFWQAKIWGLLRDSPLKALHKNNEPDEDNVWQDLEVIRTWRDLGGNSEASSNPVLKHIHLADSIVLASDRHPATDTLPQAIAQSPIAKQLLGHCKSC